MGEFHSNKKGGKKFPGLECKEFLVMVLYRHVYGLVLVPNNGINKNLCIGEIKWV